MSSADPLAELVARAIAPWALASISRSPGALVIECRDETRAVHVLECSPRRPTAALLVADRVQFGYRSAPREPAPLQRYLSIFKRLIEAEAVLVAELSRAQVAAPPPRPTGPVVYVTEHALSRRFAVAKLGRNDVKEVARELFTEWFPRNDGELHLYLEARCAQRCEFCEEAENRDRPMRRALTMVRTSLARVGVDLVDSGAFDALLDRAAEPRIPLLLTGHDWLRHPRVADILSSLERHPTVPKTFQSPSTALTDSSLFERVIAVPGLGALRTTLQSIDEREHDAMVGLRGAARDVMSVIDRLTERGVRVDLTTVLTRRALPTLPATVRWIAERGLTVTLHAFIPDRGMASAAAALAPLDELRSALAAIDRPSAIMSLVGVPRCVIPEALASKLEPAWEFAERGRMLFADGCGACESRSSCSGVPEDYLRAFGDRGMAPSRSGRNGAPPTS